MAFVVAGLVLVGLAIFVARALPESQVGEGAFIKRLEKFSPLLIGLVWIAYGILHFATPSNAVAQIPRYLEPWRSALSAAAGAVEIALGLLSISARWRKRVFLGQLALLAALTPFVVYLLIEDAAMAPMAGDMPLSLARLVLIFHNVLLFLWIYWAYEQASVSNGGDLTDVDASFLIGPFRRSGRLPV